MDKFVAMNVFRHVVQCGSFARAAEKLGLSTTAASRHIANLEESLGSVLLHRSTRKISVSEKGKIYYERCCDLLDQLAETESLVCESDARVVGRLRVSAPVTLAQKYIIPHIPDFLMRHPELRLEISLNDCQVDLAEEGVDVAIRVTQKPQSHLIARPLAPARIALCASPAYLARHGTPETPQDLMHHNCLTHAHVPGTWRFIREGQLHEVPIRGQLHTDSCDMLRTAALAHQGIILEPTFNVGADLCAGRLVSLLPGYAYARQYQIYAVYLSSNRNSGRVLAFVDFVEELFGRGSPVWDQRLPDAEGRLTEHQLAAVAA